ncbi:unnamed protein product, partial [Phaeothamnion confervicola]
PQQHQHQQQQGLPPRGRPVLARPMVPQGGPMVMHMLPRQPPPLPQQRRGMGGVGVPVSVGLGVGPGGGGGGGSSGGGGVGMGSVAGTALAGGARFIPRTTGFGPGGSVPGHQLGLHQMGPPPPGSMLPPGLAGLHHHMGAQPPPPPPSPFGPPLRHHMPQALPLHLHREWLGGMAPSMVGPAIPLAPPTGPWPDGAYPMSAALMGAGGGSGGGGGGGVPSRQASPPPPAPPAPQSALAAAEHAPAPLPPMESRAASNGELSAEARVFVPTTNPSPVKRVASSPGAPAAVTTPSTAVAGATSGSDDMRMRSPSPALPPDEVSPSLRAPQTAMTAGLPPTVAVSQASNEGARASLAATATTAFSGSWHPDSAGGGSSADGGVAASAAETAPAVVSELGKGDGLWGSASLASSIGGIWGGALAAGAFVPVGLSAGGDGGSNELGGISSSSSSSNAVDRGGASSAVSLGQNAPPLDLGSITSSLLGSDSFGRIGARAGPVADRSGASGRSEDGGGGGGGGAHSRGSMTATDGGLNDGGLGIDSSELRTSLDLRGVRRLDVGLSPPRPDTTVGAGANTSGAGGGNFVPFSGTWMDPPTSAAVGSASSAVAIARGQPAGNGGSTAAAGSTVPGILGAMPFGALGFGGLGPL